MNWKSKSFVFLLLLFFHYTHAQTNEGEKQLEEVIEALAESEEADLDNSLLLEDLTKSAEHQICINTASDEELEQLGILDFRQVQNLRAYRNQNGNLVSIYELSVIDGFTPDVIALLTPFVTFSLPADSVNTTHKLVFHHLMMRVKSSFPSAKGYRSVSESKGAVYPGWPLSAYLRYTVEIPGKLEFGFVADNDAGEEFFKGPNKQGFDHYSGYLSWKSRGLLREVTIGDFLLRFGQGVNFGAGSGLGKSGNVLGIMKSGQKVRPFTSTDENRFFRGISATIGKGAYNLSLFYSNKYRDANTVQDEATDEMYFTSLQTSGYHRTLSEIADERSVNEQIVGAYSEWRYTKFRIGALYVHQKFNLPMDNGTSPYKAKSYSGIDNFNTGIDYQLAFRNIQVFGEAGVSKSLKPGGVQGMVWHAHPQASWALCYRHFDPAFHAFYGSSLSESSGNRNETGLYTGVLLSPVPKVKVACYLDLYRFPFMTYSTLSPGKGRDLMAQVDVAWTKKFSAYLKIKYEAKPQKTSAGSGGVADYDEKTTRFRIHSEYVLSNRISLRSRFEYSGYSFNNLDEHGFLLFQDILYSPASRLNLWLRYAWFNTDSYNTRIYTFENDLLYSFSIPEFHGSGHRIYINLKWSPASRMTAYLKAGCTIHNGASTWGSGNDVTSGNKRFELRGLLYFRF